MNKINKFVRLNYLIYFSILLVVLFANISFSLVCCTDSDNADAYCQEFDSSQEAYELGCASGMAQPYPCEMTQCGQLGCCNQNSACSWKTKTECFDGAFEASTDCSLVDACDIVCCVQERNGQYNFVENVGSDFLQKCVDNEDKPYSMPCAEIPDITGSYGSISGIVSDELGNPLQGVVVYIGPYSRVTDQDGEYSFEQFPIGTYSILAYYEYYSLVDSIEVNVMLDQHVERDFNLVSNENSYSTIRGQVLDTNNNGLFNAIVAFNMEVSTRTDMEGYYTLIVDAPAGSYEIVASKSNYRSQVIKLDTVPGGIHSGHTFVLPDDRQEGSCRNGVLDPGEECEYPDLGNCPGQCNECQCPTTCTEEGYFCADLDYQCTNVNGEIKSSFNSDCSTSYNLNFGGGICCDEDPYELPICMYGETSLDAHIGFTDVSQTGGSFCKCGREIFDTFDSTEADPKYCCVDGGNRKIQDSPCVSSGAVLGKVSSGSDNVEGVRIQISSLYQTVSNSSIVGDNYKIDNIAPGQYLLTATKPGYNDYSRNIQVNQDQMINHDIELTENIREGPPLRLDLSAVRGSSDVKLDITIGDISGIEYYTIYRDDTPHISVPKSEIDLAIVKYDNTAEWGKTYTYNVTAYGVGGIVIDSVESIFIVGDSACENILTENEFCASNNCFITASKESCHQNDNPPLMYRAKCNQNNFMVYATGSSTDSKCDGACISLEGSTVCQGENDCVTLGLPPSYNIYTSDYSNIFGLFYDASYSDESCTQTSEGDYKFCYYDYFYSNIFNRNEGSYSVVDQCLNCHAEGSCYDYQSEGACLEDNCRYGSTYNTSCAWNSTYTEIGRGICYPEKSKSKEYCEICDVDNPVFYNSKCSQSVCTLLGACLASPSETKCTQCLPSTLCERFNGEPEACEGDGGYQFLGYPQLVNIQCNSSTIINKSDDVCSIGFCRYNYETDICYKDANYDSIPDCENSDDIACLQDVEIPSSDYIGQAFLTTKQSDLKFNILGQGTLYYCLSDEDSYCCPSSEGGRTVSFPNLDYEFESVEANKTLWYYVYSQNGIPQEIKSYDIFVDTKAPEISVEYEVLENINSLEKSDIVFTISTHEQAKNCRDLLDGSSVSSQMPTVLSTIEDSIQLSYTGLSDGTYIYTVECEDMYGNLNDTVSVEIEIDRVKLIKNAQPNLKTLNTKTVNLSLETPDKEYACYYYQIQPQASNIETKFLDVSSAAGSYSYFKRNLDLALDTTYKYKYVCYNNADKDEIVDSTDVIFTIDTKAPTTKVEIFSEGQYLDIDENEYYSNPRIKLSCIDFDQGPPNEFGCSKMRYCVTSGVCSPAQEGVEYFADNIEFKLNDLESGSYRICTQSEDLGGNVEEVVCKTINVDMSSPGVEILSPANNAILGQSSLVISGNWIDEIKPEEMLAKIVNVRGYEKHIRNLEVFGETVKGSFSGLTSLSALYKGHNSLQVMAMDSTGNYDMAISNFYYDLIPPEISLVEIYTKAPSVEGYFSKYGFVSETDMKLTYQKIVSDDKKIRSHEYGYPLRFRIYANDDEYTDLQNVRGDDVNLSMKIFNQQNDQIYSSSNFDYNSSEGFYELEMSNMQDNIFDLENYTVEYELKDVWENQIKYTQEFMVEDTLDPVYEIIIYDENGRNVTHLHYGEYDVKIKLSEPLSELVYFNYSFRGVSKAVDVKEIHDYEILGKIVISEKDLDFLELSNAAAYFSIYGIDEHNQDGSRIASGDSFLISTVGPQKPKIILPELNGENKYYSSLQNVKIAGMIYKTANEALKDGRVILLSNKVSGDLVDNSWTTEKETTTSSNEIINTWEYSKYDDLITIKDAKNLIIHDYDNLLKEGKYIEFNNYLSTSREAYKIVSKSFVRTDGSKDLYSLTLDRNVEGFEDFEDGDTFYDNIKIYDTKYPDGRFEFDVQMVKGENNFYVESYDNNNPGKPSDVFTIIYDNDAPFVYNTSPMDNSVIGNSNPTIYALIDMTGSDVKFYNMKLDGVNVEPLLSYDELGFVKIQFTPQNLEEGEHIVNVLVEDMFDLTLNYKWSFVVNYDIPEMPEISPSSYINTNKPVIKSVFNQNVVILSAELQKEDGTIVPLSPSGEDSIFTFDYNGALNDEKYIVRIKAKKKNMPDSVFGEYISRFDVDTTAPKILNLADILNFERIPFSISYRTDEYSTCKYDFKKFKEFSKNYDQFEFLGDIDYSTQHSMRLYDVPSLEFELMLSCKDRAGNKMIPEKVDVFVESLLYSMPKIYFPKQKLIIENNSKLEILGSTFGESDTRNWAPDVNMKISKSNSFVTNDVEFENEFYLKSFEDSYFGTIKYPDMSINFNLNSVDIIDTRKLLSVGRYVEFVGNYREDFKLYKIKRIEELENSLLRVYFSTPFEIDQNVNGKIHVYSLENPKGLFEYSLNLDEGNNFIYLSALNSFSDGEKTDVYIVIYDSEKPEIVSKYPNDNNVLGIGEKINITLDGTYSNISSVILKLNGQAVDLSEEELYDNVKNVYTTSRLEEGMYSAYLYYQDQAGNSNEERWSFVVDNTVPSKPKVEPLGKVNEISKLRVNFNESVDLVEFKLVSKSEEFNILSEVVPSNLNKEYLYEFNSNLPEDDYTILISAKKENTDNTNGIWEYKLSIDTTPPEIIGLEQDVMIENLPLQVMFETDEKAVCYYSDKDEDIDLMERASQNYQKNQNIKIYSGSFSNKIYVRCIDEAGNKMLQSKIVSLNKNVIIKDVCGDALVTGIEECDINDNSGINFCSMYNPGFTAGSLICDLDICRFDTSNCVGQQFCKDSSDCSSGEYCSNGNCIAEHCSDGVKNLGEVGIDCGGADCEPCPICLNGIVESGESCDGEDWGQISDCSDLGFVSGNLRCNDNCHFDTSSCIPKTPECGNGIIEDGEQCELGQSILSCSDLGFVSGETICNNCKIDTSSCEVDNIENLEDVCGDGLLYPGEQCDGLNLNIDECSGLSSQFSLGYITCSNCELNTNDCLLEPNCGNGLLEKGEECENSLFDLECNQFGGFSSGDTMCDSSCVINTNDCSNKKTGCGDGMLQSGEQCDYNQDYNNLNLKCSKFGKQSSDNIQCNDDCMYDIGLCKDSSVTSLSCGNGLIDEELGELCEAGSVAKSCSDLGFDVGGYPSCYTQGEHACSYDVTPCGASYICSGSEETSCRNLHPLYIKGKAVCVNGYYDMSQCYWLDTPKITLNSGKLVGKSFINITGRVSKATSLELYVNDVFIDIINYTSPAESGFIFRDVFLSKNTLNSDGKNKITLISYGAIREKVSKLEYYIVYDTIGPEISLQKPKYGYVAENKPVIIANTSKTSNCRVKYGKQVSNLFAHEESMISENGILHEIELSNSLKDEVANQLKIICEDDIKNEEYLDFNLVVDKENPIITDANILIPKIIVSENSNEMNLKTYHVMNGSLLIKTNEETICKYEFNDANYDEMINFNGNTAFNTNWKSRNIVSNLLDFKLNVQCQDKAGLLSDIFVFNVEVDPDSPIVITNKNGEYVRGETPDLNFATNRPAECKIKYGNIEQDLVMSIEEDEFMHSLNVKSLGLIMRHAQKYDFEVSCDPLDAPNTVKPVSENFRIESDQEKPFIEILNPENNDILTTQKVLVEISTEAKSNVIIELEDIEQGSKYSDDGSADFEIVLNQDKNTINVKVVDKAGNQNSESVVVYFAGQEIAPEIVETFPEDRGIVNSLNKITARVHTIYGSDLNLTKTNVSLVYQNGNVINGEKIFTRGTPEEPIGLFEYDLGSDILEGKYNLTIQVYDEFGSSSAVKKIGFEVNKDKPILLINDPFIYDSEELGDSYRIRPDTLSFNIVGRIESDKDIIDSKYRINKGRGYGERKELQLHGNDEFDFLMTFDELSEGETKTYVVLFEIDNGVIDKYWEYPVEIIYDLEAPIPIEVRVDNKKIS